ncbi:hypothetical protein [Orientia tsutsugamushi]|uniref:hypothetical protein n=1 Tax=Orientia tsutsugamushi TaxID=784 RepID=UPI000A9D0DB1
MLLNKNHTTHYKFKLILKINKLLFNYFKYRNRRKRFGLSFNLISGIYNFELR